MSPSRDMTAALATLQARWGAAAPVRGALALAPSPVATPAGPDVAPEPELAEGRVISTGFAALDAILGPGGLPRTASVALRGAGSSGKTTLALRLAAEAQVAGSIVAWLDLARSLDPVEAVARGVQLEWFLHVDPETVDEGLTIAGSLLAGRTVDLLVIDLPGGQAAPARAGPGLADRLARLAALARRAGTLLVVLEPPRPASSLAGAVAEATGLRLELERRTWIRLGRDIVGQRTAVTVARNRFGPPGRQAELRILYADGGERDACLRRAGLLDDPAEPFQQAPILPLSGMNADATPPYLLAAPPARPGTGASGALRLLPRGAGRPRRAAVDGRPGDRRERRRAAARGPAGDAARERPPARA